MSEPPRSLQYSQVAAIALPALLAALAYLIYRDVSRPGSVEPRVATSALPGAPAPPRPSTSGPAPTATPAPAASQVFGLIYSHHIWGAGEGDAGTSGSGSTLESTLLYRTYVQAFMKKHQIRSVVDAGCGDWEFSNAIDWTGIEYKGYDVVEPVIAKDRAKYNAANVHFFVADVTTDDLPPADLLVSKHVLQHLPNADVSKFLARLGSKYRHVLLTNSVDATLSAANSDIALGDYRPLDPTRPPFDAPGVKVLAWFDGHHNHQVVHLARHEATQPR